MATLLRRIAITLCILAATSAPIVACGPDTHCKLGDRHYRIAMPQSHDGKTPVGAIVFAHGYQGSASGVMRNKTLRRTASDLGVALIAVKSVGQDWDIPHAPLKPNSDGSNEFKYFDAVIEDATSKFAIDKDRLMVTGFSAGGMMVWNLICARSNKFAAFAPMAGTFWQKMPPACKRPVANVIHIHGATDRTVPLKGRKILDTYQGNVMEILTKYKEFGRFGAPKQRKSGNLTCQNRTNAKGDVMNFCLYPGQHSFSSKFVKFAWESFDAAGKL